jgi:hypothetical protein
VWKKIKKGKRVEKERERKVRERFLVGGCSFVCCHVFPVYIAYIS